jgi:hypothetical protein
MLQSRSRREYRAKAFDCLSRAESMDDPEERADMLGLARMWMSLGEPLGDIPGAYEYSSQSHDVSEKHVSEKRPTPDSTKATSLPSREL